MAKLVDIWRIDNPADLKKRQMPLIVDDNLTMIMDVKNLGVISDSPLIRGKQLDDFMKKFQSLTKDEARYSLQVPSKNLFIILGQTVPCVGCRRSVERLSYDLMRAGDPLLDPLMFKNDMLTVKEELLEFPQMLCTILHKHNTRLDLIVEKQARSKKSHRCALHSLEVQRMRPPPSAWREVWECMKQPCRQEVTLIQSSVLEATLETYLRKHRFCSECRTKVLLASSLLTSDSEPTKEKGYVAALYAGIKRCPDENHVHLPTDSEYINKIISRAQPEILGRERHAKTLEIAQEEVVTCLGICVAERLHRMHRRLKEAETISRVLAAVAVEALSRSFETAVEAKQGMTKLDLLYEELTRKEIAKQQRQEKLKLKRKLKKVKRSEVEEKENSCEPLNDNNSESKESSNSELKVVIENDERQKLQKIDYSRETKSIEKTIQETLATSEISIISNISNNKGNKLAKKVEKTPLKKKDSGKNKKEFNDDTCNNTSKGISESINTQKKSQTKEKPSLETKQSNGEDNEKMIKVNTNQEWSLNDNSVTNLAYVWLNQPNNMWTEMKEQISAKIADRNCRSSSEHSSRDRGYSSEPYASSGSFSCTPEGSDVACSEGFCNHEEKSSDRPFLNPFRIHGCEGPTLMQMLEDSDSENQNMDSYIPMEEVIEFQSKMSYILEKRQELRKKLKNSFEMMCNHRKPFIPY